MNLLKSLNHELEQRKLYSGNFDKLSEYCINNSLNESAIKSHQNRTHALKQLLSEDQISEESSERCLST